MSVAAARIVQEASKPDVEFARLARLVQCEPGMAMRVLSVVNSPPYHLAVRVSDVQQAISMIGLRGLRNIALSLMLVDVIPPSKGAQALLSNALRRAVACQRIGARTGAGDDGSYFTTGLFLEAGYFLHAAGDLKSTLEIVQEPAARRIVHERRLGWEPHPRLGAEFALELALPTSMANAIGRHHDDEPSPEPLARAAWLAERIAALFEGDRAGLVMRATWSARRLGLTKRDVDQLLEEIPEAVAEIAESLSCEVSSADEMDQLLVESRHALVELNQQYEQLVRTLERVVAEKEDLAERLRHANLHLERLAVTDPLTLLPNKRGLVDFLRRTMSRAARENTPVSLLMVDVDHFKSFNDRWGHSMGDEVLRKVASVLQSSLRSSDMAARYGGEEFTIVLPMADAAGAFEVADRLRRSVADARVEGPEGPLSITVSVGAATALGRGPAAMETLFNQADEKLYRAKHAGRNRVCGAQAA